MKALALIIALAACGSKKEPAKQDPPKQAAAGSQAEKPPPVDDKPTPTEKPVETPKAPAGHPPKDGKYERVQVDGTTVPMINVMEGGKVILVDTDGAKPRTWEEQYKQKRALEVGQYDIHKTDTNKNNKFDDDAIDKEGLWVIDDKGNITKH